jgi:ferredoxin-NADP reductase
MEDALELPDIFDGTIVEKKLIAEETYLLGVKIQSDFIFRPGQYVLLSIEVERDGETQILSRELSIASGLSILPTIELAFRHSESQFKTAISKSALGAKVKVEGPYGLFSFGDSDSSILCIAGGIGVTPFRSMIGELLSLGDKKQITLVYANSTNERAAFIDEFRDLALKYSNFTLKEIRGQVDDELLKSLSSENKSAQVYIAGPTKMVFHSQDVLLSSGIPASKIMTEEFTGYSGN